MAGRRAIKAINWAPLAERIHEEEKNILSAFKAKSDLYLRRLQQNPETPPKIDWAYYKKAVGVSGLVDKFQKEYESIKIPYPEDKYTSQIEAQEKAAEQEVQKFIQESNVRIEETKQKIKHLEGLLSYGQMTMEDFMDAHPENIITDENRLTMFFAYAGVPHEPKDDVELTHH